MKPEDAAWLAGYIDGDGCISLNPNGHGTRRRPLLIVDSADKEILYFVVSLIGGTIITKKKYKEHHRQAYTWRLSGNERVITVLRAIHPYMRCAFKAERARLLLCDWKACTPRNGFYTAEMKHLKDTFENSFMAVGEGRGKRAQPIQ